VVPTAKNFLWMYVHQHGVRATVVAAGWEGFMLAFIEQERVSGGFLFSHKQWVQVSFGVEIRKGNADQSACIARGRADVPSRRLMASSSALFLKTLQSS